MARSFAYTHRVGSFTAFSYAVNVKCPCGHQRVIQADWLLKLLGPDYELSGPGEEEFVSHLRCSNCGTKGPPITVDVGRY